MNGNNSVTDRVYTERMSLLGPKSQAAPPPTAQALPAPARYAMVVEGKPMKMFLAALAAVLLLPSLGSAAERYTLKDGGDFAPVGYRVEFADRYGWSGYQVNFDFGLEDGNRALTKDSKLSVKIIRNDGSTWSYTCKAKGSSPMWANINFLYGQGVSVVAECRIPEKKFAKAVGLDPDDVGVPNFVFQAVIKDGHVSPGDERGLYFLPGGQIEGSDLATYANAGDPSNLAVVFRSN